MEQFSYRVTLSFRVHRIPAIAISHALRNAGRFKVRGERNKLFAALAVFASSGILSRNYLLLTGRSRKRSPSPTSIAPFSSSLPSFLGVSLPLSLSLSPLFIDSQNQAHCTHQCNYSWCTQQLLSSRGLFSWKYASVKKVHTERQRVDELKWERKK